MADRIYLRHSTDKQTDARQRRALAALLAAGAPAYEDPATSSRQLSLDRAGFTRLLHEAAVGDTIRIADAARLFRSVADILALRPVLARRGLHLRVEIRAPVGDLRRPRHQDLRQEPRPPHSPRHRPGRRGRGGLPERHRDQSPRPTTPRRPQDHPSHPGQRPRPRTARPTRHTSGPQVNRPTLQRRRAQR
ncbi:recombinase family protein [Actinomadura rubrisoli]|uniref:recombinase family protein n=1 Tax=Actinomadura rubrisoli TaxID=2530368 RepID=UPI001A9F5CA1